MVILQFEFNEIVQNWMVSCIISLFGFLFVVRAIWQLKMMYFVILWKQEVFITTFGRNMISSYVLYVN